MTNHRANSPHPDAMSAFVAHKLRFDELLEQLRRLSEDHFCYDPDDINWGHVGSVESYVQQLQRVVDMAEGR